MGGMLSLLARRSLNILLVVLGCRGNLPFIAYLPKRDWNCDKRLARNLMLHVAELMSAASKVCYLAERCPELCLFVQANEDVLSGGVNYCSAMSVVCRHTETSFFLDLRH